MLKTDMLAAERRQAIIESLCETRHDTRANLAKKFNVSTRTIENDISRLSQTYPIYTTSGYKGGIYVMDGFYLFETEKFKFNPEQLDLLERLFNALTGKDKDLMAGIIKYGGGRISNESVWFCPKRWECVPDSELHRETNG